MANKTRPPPTPHCPPQIQQDDSETKGRHRTGMGGSEGKEGRKVRRLKRRLARCSTRRENILRFLSGPSTTLSSLPARRGPSSHPEPPRPELPCSTRSCFCKGKARRLKQAKEEAQMEVEQYRREREQEFQSKQQAAMGSQGNLSAEVEQATRRQVQGMQSSQQRNRERVLAQLLGMVFEVRPQVHPNYRVTA
ncbi:V-type proton ATPase subunit G 2 isoform X1 [Tenrec ecaudatus]|uniref:V-type proton ATPase subunit G 2 isoform X1 n=1 Tax=Tenrec ecaudatus TaxID=94439 RepID=UPI003F59A336